MTAKKQRPKPGDRVQPGDSERDLAIKLGMSRRQIWQAKKIAGIPEDQFEELVEGDNPPTVSALLDLAHHRAGSDQVARVATCPHCGGKL